MTHTRPQPGLLADGWTRLRQSHKVLWWIYIVNLVLASFSAVALAMRLGRVLDHSLAAHRLVRGMDLGALMELLALPEVQPRGAFQSSLAASALFFLFLLFALGGILQSFHMQRHLVPGEFFQAAGAFLWRLVRLLIWTILALIPVAIVFALLNNAASRLGDRSSSDALGFYLRLVAVIIGWVLLTAVRLVIDVAQVKLVVEDRRRVTRVLGEAIRLTRTHFLTLFWMYLRINLVGWIGAAVLLWCWVKVVPPELALFSFLIGQAIALLWIIVRLWQRASEVAWFERLQFQVAPAAAPDPFVEEPLEEPPAGMADYISSPDPPANG